MNKNEIISKTKTAFSKACLQLKKHSPEILMVAGIAGTVASTVIACKATTKIDTILDETNEKVNLIHSSAENGCVEGSDGIVSYSKDDEKKDLTIVYTKTALKFIKLYAPAVAVGVLSVTSILASHNILKRRNVAIAAAYTAIDRGFKEYRSRVVERFGEQTDKELRYGVQEKSFKEKTVDENGKEKTVTKKIPIALEEHSEYARCFDDGNTCWEKDSDANRYFLQIQQNYANELLRARGHLFLNEVYDMLGFPRTKAGQVVGWVYELNDPKHQGDNYVDFGIYDTNKEKIRDFNNGYEPTIWLDFNVDGIIYDLI